MCVCVVVGFLREFGRRGVVGRCWVSTEGEERACVRRGAGGGAAARRGSNARRPTSGRPWTATQLPRLPPCLVAAPNPLVHLDPWLPHLNLHRAAASVLTLTMRAAAAKDAAPDAIACLQDWPTAAAWTATDLPRRGWMWTLLRDLARTADEGARCSCIFEIFDAKGCRGMETSEKLGACGCPRSVRRP